MGLWRVVEGCGGVCLICLKKGRFLVEVLKGFKFLRVLVFKGSSFYGFKFLV